MDLDLNTIGLWSRLDTLRSAWRKVEYSSLSAYALGFGGVGTAVSAFFAAAKYTGSAGTQHISDLLISSGLLFGIGFAIAGAFKYRNYRAFRNEATSLEQALDDKVESLSDEERVIWDKLTNPYYERTYSNLLAEEQRVIDRLAQERHQKSYDDLTGDEREDINEYITLPRDSRFISTLLRLGEDTKSAEHISIYLETKRKQDELYGANFTSQLSFFASAVSFYTLTANYMPFRFESAILDKFSNTVPGELILMATLSTLTPAILLTLGLISAFSALKLNGQLRRLNEGLERSHQGLSPDEETQVRKHFGPAAPAA